MKLLSALALLCIRALPALSCESCESLWKRDPAADDIVLTRHVRRMQPDALNATSSPRAPLEWGQLNVLHTTDTHGWLEGHIKEKNYGADWGDWVSFVKHMRKEAEKLDVDLLLVDTGVRSDHTPIATARVSEPENTAHLEMGWPFGALLTDITFSRTCTMELASRMPPTRTV